MRKLSIGKTQVEPPVCLTARTWARHSVEVLRRSDRGTLYTNHVWGRSGSGGQIRLFGYTTGSNMLGAQVMSKICFM